MKGARHAKFLSDGAKVVMHNFDTPDYKKVCKPVSDLSPEAR